MNLTKLTDNLNIISSLPDQPTLSAEDLKAKFDEAGNAIKEYINDILIDDIESGVSSDLSSMKTTLLASIDEEMETLKTEVTDSVDEQLDTMQSTIDSLSSTVTSLSSSISSIGTSVSYTVNSGSVSGNIAKVGKLVVMDCMITGSFASGATTTMITIASGSRPSSKKTFYCNGDANGLGFSDTLYVNTNGTVQIVASSSIANARSLVNIHASWLTS